MGYHIFFLALIAFNVAQLTYGITSRMKGYGYDATSYVLYLAQIAFLLWAYTAFLRNRNFLVPLTLFCILAISWEMFGWISHGNDLPNVSYWSFRFRDAPGASWRNGELGWWMYLTFAAYATPLALVVAARGWYARLRSRQ